MKLSIFQKALSNKLKKEVGKANITYLDKILNKIKR